MGKIFSCILLGGEAPGVPADTRSLLDIPVNVSVKYSCIYHRYRFRFAIAIGGLGDQGSISCFVPWLKRVPYLE